jgi:hypothetical protein
MRLHGKTFQKTVTIMSMLCLDLNSLPHQVEKLHIFLIDHNSDFDRRVLLKKRSVMGKKLQLCHWVEKIRRLVNKLNVTIFHSYIDINPGRYMDLF